ncbi:hypothetical protein KJ966_21920 [bacterium]|nr:hypothetical protein [bacterium]
MKIDWKETKVSEDESHHLHNSQPLYQNRFIHVLKYHDPGVAPVEGSSGAFHIDLEGKELYSERYSRTFGFYEGLATVEDKIGNAFHIKLDGSRPYSENHSWCGNFQFGYAPVRLSTGDYVHIRVDGKPLTKETWGYAGDFRDQCAVVQNKTGLHSHIKDTGEMLHDIWFKDLGVYHKGYALAQDSKGWFHINKKGEEIYSERFAKAEPFYNGQSRVETYEGEILVINESGNTQCVSKKAKDHFSSVSADLVGYWKSFTLKAAVEFGVFNGEKISENQYPPVLLRALWDMGYLLKSDNQYRLTPKSQILSLKTSPNLCNATLTFTDSIHLSPWMKITESLRDGSSKFLQENKSDWFSILKQNPEKLNTYQKAMNAYATKDYKAFSEYFPGNNHSKVLDAGGGQGFLLMQVLKAFPHLKCILLESEQVIKSLVCDLEAQSFNLLKPWPEQGDAIVLARVLHDWDDENSLIILKNAYDALEAGGSLYIVEMLKDLDKPYGGLLNLHMFLTTQGTERNLGEYQRLLKKSGFTYQKTIPMESISQIIIAEKD